MPEARWSSGDVLGPQAALHGPGVRLGVFRPAPVGQPHSEGIRGDRVRGGGQVRTGGTILAPGAIQRPPYCDSL